MALRAMPTIGAEVVIEHLGSVQDGVVDAVDLAARTVSVVAEDGRRHTFALNRATARFTADGGLTAPRLRFPDV